MPNKSKGNPRPRYKVLDDDQIVKVRMNTAPYSIRLTCCDCGLAHDVRILKYKGGGLAEDELEMIFTRNRRSTEAHRRKFRGAGRHWDIGV